MDVHRTQVSNVNICFAILKSTQILNNQASHQLIEGVKCTYELNDGDIIGFSCHGNIFPKPTDDLHISKHVH